MSVKVYSAVAENKIKLTWIASCWFWSVGTISSKAVGCMNFWLSSTSTFSFSRLCNNKPLWKKKQNFHKKETSQALRSVQLEQSWYAQTVFIFHYLELVWRRNERPYLPNAVVWDKAVCMGETGEKRQWPSLYWRFKYNKLWMRQKLPVKGLKHWRYSKAFRIAKQLMTVRALHSPFQWKFRDVCSETRKVVAA